VLFEALKKQGENTGTKTGFYASYFLKCP